MNYVLKNRGGNIKKSRSGSPMFLLRKGHGIVGYKAGNCCVLANIRVYFVKECRPETSLCLVDRKPREMQIFPAV